MESKKDNKTYLAGIPNTERLFSSHMSVSACGKFIGYCSKYLIIIRNLEVKIKNKLKKNKESFRKYKNF
jgi:hypothetical protein